MSNFYLTVEDYATFELTEKKSKFIGHIYPVNSEQNSNILINKIKSKYWNAKHNVYAYNLLDNNFSKFSDDGEPHGTAGAPILDIINKNKLVNVLIIVTRYFGGVLLGTGGLVRAYSQTASETIKAANIIKMSCCYTCVLYCNYDFYGKISNIINDFNSRICETNFLNKVKIKFYVQINDFKALSKKILEISSGRINCEILNKDFYRI